MNSILISELSFGYSDEAPPRLDALDLAVGATELLGITGESGIGKTTLLRLIAGQLRPRSGSIDGPGLQSLGYTPQADVLIDFRTASQNAALLLEAAAVREEEIVEGLDFLNQAFVALRLAEFQDNLPAELSGGMRQRVQVVQSLAPRKSLLLIDEPFSEQDFGQQQAMERLIQARMKANAQAAIIVSHDLSALAALCDRILFLEGHPARVGEAAVPPPSLRDLEPAARRAHGDFIGFEFDLWRRRAGTRPT